MPTHDVGRQVARLAHRLELDHEVVTEAVTDTLTKHVHGARRPGSDRSPRTTSSMDFPFNRARSDEGSAAGIASIGAGRQAGAYQRRLTIGGS